MRCANCKFFGRGVDLPEGSIFGHCERWREGYQVKLKDLAPNDAWVEDDEGWGNVVGPDFGCVLFERFQGSAE